MQRRPHTGSQVEEFLEPGSHVRRAQRVENVRPDARLEVRILIVVQLPVLLAREHCGACATKVWAGANASAMTRLTSECDTRMAVLAPTQPSYLRMAELAAVQP